MLQWMDDFSSYGLGADTAARQISTLRMLNGLYAEVGGASKAILWPDPDPTEAGQAVLRVGSNNTESDARVRKVLSAPQTTVGVAARYWLDNLPSGAGYNVFVSFLNVTLVKLCELREDPSGYLEVYNGSGVRIARSDAPVIISNAWRHIETKVVFDAVAGEVEVRLEGVTVINEVGVNTVGAAATPTCQNVCLNGKTGGTPMMYVKDYIIWDGSGAVNNDFLGSCQVYKIVPDGDVSLGWTPSAGAVGWDLINESTPPDDAAYISADPTPPPLSQFSMTDLPDDVTSVKGVMFLQRSRKSDGGDGNVQVSLTDGVNTEAGVDRAITTAWTYWTDMFNLAPDGLNWSKAKVNAVQATIDRTV